MGRSLPLHPPIPAASSSPCYWPSTGQHTARLPCVQTECTQLIGTIQPLEGFESGMLDADRPGVAVREGLDSDPLPVTLSPSGASDRCSWRSSRRLTIRRATGPLTSQPLWGSVLKLSVV